MSDHAFLEASSTGGQPRISGCSPFVRRVARGVKCSFEHTGVCKHHHSGHVAEAQRGEYACLHCTGTQREGSAQPDQGLGQWLDGRVNAVEGCVLRQVAGGQDVAESCGLEERSATLGVSGEGLLGDHEQRVSGVASQGIPQQAVEFGLVGVVGVGGRVVLAHYAHVVGGEAKTVQRAGQRGVGSSSSGGKCTESRSRDGGVDAVGVGLCVGNHSVDRQSELGGDVTTCEEDGASAFGFDEACAAAVVGA